MTSGWQLASRYFPNTSSRAYYSPQSFSVFMPEDEVDQDRRADEAYFGSWIAKRLPVIVHEYQHALDHTGTVAGRKLVDSYFAAMRALDRKLQGDSSQLWRFVAFHDARRDFFRQTYFNEYDPGYAWDGDERPRWSWSTSTGVGFDQQGRADENAPIFFVRFTDDDQGRRVARQPITSASLFETRAVYAELEHSAARVVATARGDEAVIAEFERAQQTLFYDHTQTLYSAPAHYASSKCGSGNALEAYKLAAYAAGIILNLAPGLELNPPIPEIFRDPASMARLERLIAQRDPGFLFALLIGSAPHYEGDIFAWLDAALGASGFPARTDIMRAAFEHLAIPSAERGPLGGAYLNVMTAGHTNFGRLRETCGLLDVTTLAAGGTPRGPFALPPVLFANDTLYPQSEGFFEPDDQVEMLRLEPVMASQMDEFLAACR